MPFIPRALCRPLAPQDMVARIESMARGQPAPLAFVDVTAAPTLPSATAPSPMTADPSTAVQQIGPPSEPSSLAPRLPTGAVSSVASTAATGSVSAAGGPVTFRTRDYIVYCHSATGQLYAVTYASPSGRRTQAPLRPDQLVPHQPILDEAACTKWCQEREASADGRSHPDQPKSQLPQGAAGTAAPFDSAAAPSVVVAEGLPSTIPSGTHTAAASAAPSVEPLSSAAHVPSSPSEVLVVGGVPFRVCTCTLLFIKELEAAAQGALWFPELAADALGRATEAIEVKWEAKRIVQSGIQAARR